jgi:hypothetical protein
VGFVVGENDRGPVAQNAARAQAIYRARPELDGVHVREREQDN